MLHEIDLFYVSHPALFLEIAGPGVCDEVTITERKDHASVVPFVTCYHGECVRPGLDSAFSCIDMQWARRMINLDPLRNGHLRTAAAWVHEKNLRVALHRCLVGRDKEEP